MKYVVGIYQKTFYSEKEKDIIEKDVEILKDIFYKDVEEIAFKYNGILYGYGLYKNNYRDLDFYFNNNTKAKKFSIALKKYIKKNDIKESKIYKYVSNYS